MSGRRWGRVSEGMRDKNLRIFAESNLLSKISILLPVCAYTCLMSLSLCLSFIYGVQFILLRPHLCRFRFCSPSLNPVDQHIPISQRNTAQVDWDYPWSADRLCTQPRARLFPRLGPHIRQPMSKSHWKDHTPPTMPYWTDVPLNSTKDLVPILYGVLQLGKWHH